MQLAKLGESLGRNLSIQKMCIWDGPIILAHFAPSNTLKELDVSLVDAHITRAVIDALPKLTNLQKMVLQTSELVGLSPSVAEWKLSLMWVILQWPKLDNVVTDGRMPVFNDQDRARMDRWMQRNKTLGSWQEGGCAPPSQGLLPKLFESIQDISTGQDFIFDLLAGGGMAYASVVGKQ
jgi:hypothetical protein